MSGMTAQRTAPAFTIGRFSVYRIEEWQGRFSLPEGLFAEFESVAFDAKLAGLDPDYVRDGMIYGYLQSWLIDADGQTIVIDTGAGNGKARPGIPVFGDMDTDFLDRLSATGFEPEDIDIVINTHLHIDHVGWNTRAEAGAWRPTFANARYVMPAIDRVAWDPTGDTFSTLGGAAIHENVFEDSVQPIIDAGMAVFAEDGFVVAPGIVLRSAPGHTPGHMYVDVEADGERALFVGDILHHPMQIFRPDWNSVFCEDRTSAAATRHKVLSEVARSGARLVPAHFGGAHSVFVTQGANGFEPVFDGA